MSSLSFFDLHEEVEELFEDKEHQEYLKSVGIEVRDALT